MKKTRLFTVLTLVVFLTLSLLLTPGCKEKKEEQKVIKIGAILPLTGGLAFLGKPEQVALQIAANEVNSTGKLKVEIIFGDSKGDPKEGVTLANKMINIDKVNAIITSTSGVSMAVAPIVSQNKILNFSGCTAPEVVSQGKTVFRLFINANEEARILGNYILKYYKNVAGIVINNRGPLSEMDSLNSFLKSNGVLVEFIETYELNQLNFSNLINKMKDSRVEAIIVIGYGPEIPGIFKLMKEQNVDKPSIGSISFLMPVALSEGTEIFKNVVFASFPFTKDDPKFSEFNKKYEKIANTAPSTFADSVFFYDMVMIISDSVLQTGGVNGEQLAQFIISKKQFEGLSGIIKFDENRDSIIPMKMARYRGGIIEFLER